MEQIIAIFEQHIGMNGRHRKANRSKKVSEYLRRTVPTFVITYQKNKKIMLQGVT